MHIASERDHTQWCTSQTSVIFFYVYFMAHITQFMVSMRSWWMININNFIQSFLFSIFFVGIFCCCFLIWSIFLVWSVPVRSNCIHVYIYSNHIEFNIAMAPLSSAVSSSCFCILLFSQNECLHFPFLRVGDVSFNFRNIFYACRSNSVLTCNGVKCIRQILLRYFGHKNNIVSSIVQFMYCTTLQPHLLMRRYTQIVGNQNTYLHPTSCAGSHKNGTAWIRTSETI